MYKNSVNFDVVNRIIYINRGYPTYLDCKLSEPIWMSFCDQIDDAFAPLIATNRRECRVRTLTILICFGGWIAVVAVWALEIIQLAVWAFGVISMGLLMVFPIGITCLLIRIERIQLERWPDRIRTVCEKASSWSPGIAFQFRYNENRYYMSFIEIMVNEDNRVEMAPPKLNSDRRTISKPPSHQLSNVARQEQKQKQRIGMEIAELEKLNSELPLVGAYLNRKMTTLQGVV